MFHLVALLACVAGVQGLFYDIDNDDFGPNSTYLYLDVTAHKGVGADLKTAFSRLKHSLLAFKVIGEDRGVFVLPDDDKCESLITNFPGFKVEAQPVQLLNTTGTLPKNFEDKGLLLLELYTPINATDLLTALNSSQDACDNCFHALQFPGTRPRKIVIIGNIPVENLDEIVDIAAGDEGSASTRRLVNFSSYSSKHATSCIDVHKASIPNVHVYKNPAVVAPVHKPRISKKYRLHSAPVKSGTFKSTGKPVKPVAFDHALPRVTARVSYPRGHPNLYVQHPFEFAKQSLKAINVLDSHKGKLTSDAGHGSMSFAEGHMPNQHGFDAYNANEFALNLNSNPSSRYVF